jgi:hypothetical protein
MEKIPKCRMNTYPALTISLLARITNRELQFNYLNHLDRTAEVTSLLTQITDPDLALRLVNSIDLKSSLL